jgi:phage gp36-like protein
VDYCTIDDLHEFGIPRGSVPNPGRVVASVNTTDNTFTLDAHDLTTDLPITFRAGPGGALPAPLVAGTTYYAEPVDEARFRARAAVGGAAVDLTTAGSIVMLLVPLNKSAAIAWASRRLDEMLPGHVVPLEAGAVPEVIVHVCAELAAWKLTGMRGGVSKSLSDMYKAADEVVKRWAKGVPVRGAPQANKRANLAVSATLPYADAKGWNKYGGIC